MPDRVSRRQFVQSAGVAGLGLLAGCGRLPGLAPEPPKTPRVGFLGVGDNSNPKYEAFRAGLRELGYVEDQNVAVEYRLSGGETDQLPALATQLSRLPVDVIVTEGTLATAAARAATGAIPIVMAQNADPVGNGFVASLARPGGTITGLSTYVPQLSRKRLDLLKETLPALTRVGVPWDSMNGSVAAIRLQLQETEAAGEILGVQVLALQVHGASDLERAVQMAMRESVEALIVFGDPLTTSRREQIVGLAAQSRLPVMYANREFVDVSGLMAYGANVASEYRRAAYYVDRILRGTPPADLPVEQPTTFEFVINLQTAQALGLTIPPHVLLQATEVIQ